MEIANKALYQLLKSATLAVNNDCVIVEGVGGDLKLEVLNKLNFYKSTSLKLQEIANVKRQKVTEIDRMIKTNRYTGELERLNLVEQSLQCELDIIDLEWNIASKDFYSSVFAGQVQYHQQQNYNDLLVSDSKLKYYCDEANKLLQTNISQEDKALLHGQLATFNRGFKTNQEKIDLYRTMRNTLIRFKVKV